MTTPNHVHQWVYFGGMASCSICAATLDPDGKVGKATKSSREHQRLGQLVRKRRR